jgi:hypothetical protein
MASDIKGNASDFLQLLLSTPAGSLPKGAQWAVFFHNLNNILPCITKAYQIEPGGENKWKTEAAAASLLTDNFQKTKGCLFCQAVAVPGEGSTPISEGVIKANSYIRAHVGQGRNDFGEMRMSFLETNTSFCDSFLRGWSIATSAFGMIARSGELNYRTTATCYKFGITPKGPVVLQQMDFDGLCCINVSEEEYNYDTPTGHGRREARFLYHSYSLIVNPLGA